MGKSVRRNVDRAERHARLAMDLANQRQLHLMALPGVLWLILFCYLPMFFLVIAFQEFDLYVGILKSPFVGLAQFKDMCADELFWNSFRNTLGLSLIKLAVIFPLPIVFALLLNEVSCLPFKKLVQTFSYLPHFISWVVVAGIFRLWLDKDGMINHVLLSAHLIREPVSFLNSPGRFWILMALIDAWKETGWWSIIYIAAITAIPVELYEAALVDGAGRWRRMTGITLPALKQTIILIFILNMGGLIYGGLSGSNFNQSLLFSNPLNYDSSMVLETYVLKMGIQQARFSFATAAGLVQSVLSLVLFSATNYAAKRLDDSGLY